MMNYNKIIGIVSQEENGWKLDFSGVDFLNSFEINELMFYLANQEKFSEFEKINLIDNKGNVEYLKKIGLFAQIVNITKNFKRNIYISNDNAAGFFDSVKLYRFKQDFYGEYEAIFNGFIEIGFSASNAALITSSVGELIDNAFYHNLGQWNSDFGPLAVLMAQNIADKREINISICDFGVGFLKTLQANYPNLKNEKEAIELAIKPKITGRLNKMGGNGLVYLQKNIFNGFSGEIMIRSTNNLVSIGKGGEIDLLADSIPFNYGSNIFISLKY